MCVSAVCDDRPAGKCLIWYFLRLWLNNTWSVALTHQLGHLHTLHTPQSTYHHCYPKITSFSLPALETHYPLLYVSQYLKELDSTCLVRPWPDAVDHVSNSRPAGPMRPTKSFCMAHGGVTSTVYRLPFSRPFKGNCIGNVGPWWKWIWRRSEARIFRERERERRNGQ